MRCYLWNQVCPSIEHWKMVYKQRDMRLAKTFSRRHNNQATCLPTCPCKGKVIFTTYLIKHELFSRDYVHIIYQNYATSSQGALDPSKQAFLNIFKWSRPYKSCFRNKNMFIAYWRKVETHSQGTKYKLFTSLRYKSFFSFQNSNYMLRHSICVSLYKIQIVLTNHSGTNSKWHQYN